MSVLAWPSPAAAQEDGLQVWRTSGCFSCHGGFATGGSEKGDPDGPNLRRTRLDQEAVRERIACGRGEMPYHLEGAYTEVSCYGSPAGDPPPEGISAGPEMSEEELDALVGFLFEHVVGVPLTPESCAVYYGGDENAPACQQFEE